MTASWASGPSARISIRVCWVAASTIICMMLLPSTVSVESERRTRMSEAKPEASSTNIIAGRA